MKKSIIGDNPLSCLKDHKDYMEVSKRVYWMHPTYDTGYLNVHTGCFIAPLVKSIALFSSEFEFTGEIAVFWNTSSDGGHHFIFSEQKTKIFLNKILGDGAQ